MNSISIAEAKKQQTELEENLLEQIIEFEKATGLRIEEINRHTEFFRGMKIKDRIEIRICF